MRWWLVALVILSCFGCGKVAATKRDAGVGSDAPPNAQPCVFDKDQFNNGCTFAP